MKGRFITFEGSEGSGKSTQIQMACDYLKSKYKKIIFLREPGGVAISEKIRHILLDVENASMSKKAEMLLYMSARAQLVEEVIVPHLKQGAIVLCDRFLDSTIAYQGYGLGMDLKLIRSIGQFVTGGLSPDLTFVFDINTKKGLSRISREKDRIEKRAIAYHNRVRRGYQALAKAEPSRIKLIQASQSREDIQEIIVAHLNKLLSIRA